MASVQDRLKLKRVPYDTWSTREQLCLAASVLNSGETAQNWKTVSESLKPFAEKEALRPPDWFSQKSCAIQYSHLLETADTPKRKKRESGETQAESIVSRLTQERIAELKQILAFQRDEYQQLKAEVNLLKCGPLSDEKLQKMWQAIEQEEREQEQKARAHSAWLAKRQQKQDSTVPQSVNIHRKPGEPPTENYDGSGMDSSNNDEEEKKRGGRSPLLTSLLKSTSPTTQAQTPPVPAQAGSPTIASLLVSSPKVPSSQLDRGLSQNVSSQLQQLVSTAIASVVSERPSVGAPTLSMLLELPANSQRGPLPNLQTSTATITQPSVPPEIHTSLQTNTPTTSQNIVQIVQAPAAPVSQNIPVTESMVQIIDHIDDVIGKDIMADVIDKDEINEIIGDIEELIKEEITASPRNNETPAVTPVAETLTVQPAQETIPERLEPRNVDEPASTSDSPESEMAIEEIDSSSSNIAEIIGTVAVESTESKIIAPCESPKVDEKMKPEEADVDEDNTDEESLAEENENSLDDKGEPSEETESSPKIEFKESESNESTLTDTKDSEDQSKQQLSVSESNEDVANEETELIEDEKESARDIKGEKKEKEILEESEVKEEMKTDQLEIHLAEITGDPQEKSDETAPASETFEPTNDVASIEDTEKSQDISLILEDDESSQSSQNKDKALASEVATDILDTSESCPEESMVSTEEEADVVVKVETVVTVLAKSIAESKEDTTEEIKKEEKKEAYKNSINLIVHQADVKDEEVSRISGTDSNHSTGLDAAEIVEEEDANLQESAKNADVCTKEKEAETIIEKSIEKERKDEAEIKVKEEPAVEKKETKIEENEIPEIKTETKETLEPEPIEKTETAVGIGDDGDLDEEESSLSKLSGGRTMKTYSKRQAVTIDSEPENEGGGEGADYRAWKKAVMLVFNRLVTHKYASVFLRPITEDQAPGYHSVIFRPMDLSTIKKNIDNGTIRSTMHFQRDVMLMFQNAIMYNKQDTFVYKMAVSMQEECLQHMQILVQVTGEGPFRRETRTAASSSSDFGESSAKQQRKRSHITPSPHDSDSPRTKKRRKSEND